MSASCAEQAQRSAACLAHVHAVAQRDAAAAATGAEVGGGGRWHGSAARPVRCRPAAAPPALQQAGVPASTNTKPAHLVHHVLRADRIDRGGGAADAAVDEGVPPARAGRQGAGQVRTQGQPLSTAGRQLAPPRPTPLLPAAAHLWGKAVWMYSKKRLAYEYLRSVVPMPRVTLAPSVNTWRRIPAAGASRSAWRMQATAAAAAAATAAHRTTGDWQPRRAPRGSPTPPAP